MQRRRALMMGQKKARLPRGFREVEWIESQGAQYINTLVMANDENDIQIEFSLIESALSNKVNYVVGSFGRNDNSRTQFSYAAASFCGWGAGYATPSIAVDTIRHVFYANKRGFFLDNNLVYASTDHNFLNPASIYLFARNGNGAAGNFSNGVKEYSCKFSTNEELVRNYVPCYRVSDNKPGMYDLCGSICPLTNSPFYINAGTGEFLVGPDVN